MFLMFDIVMYFFFFLFCTLLRIKIFIHSLMSLSILMKSEFAKFVIDYGFVHYFRFLMITFYN